MDQYAAVIIARGPTFDSDADVLTGSLHILDLPDPEAARAFAFDEPGYQAGVYRGVLLRRWRNTLDRTMWDFPEGPDRDVRFLVLGPGSGPGDRPGSRSQHPQSRPLRAHQSPPLASRWTAVVRRTETDR